MGSVAATLRALDAANVQPVGSGASGVSSNNTILTGATQIQSIVETVGVVPTTPAVIDLDTETQGLALYTTALTANVTINIRASASSPLGASLAVGKAATVAIALKNTTGAFYPNAVTVDGTAVAPKWAGGIAPLSGSANATDMYTFTVVKTGAGVYEVFAVQVTYA